MRKLLAVIVSVATFLVWHHFQSMSVTAQAGPNQPALDSRFCADANGDGVLNIADAVAVLDYLFTGNATPYCVAQAQSLPFATKDETETLRAELQELRQELKAVPRVYSGQYTGDGKVDRVIAAGSTGTIRSLWVAARCALQPAVCEVRDTYAFGPSWTTAEMEPGASANGRGPRIRGSEFVLYDPQNTPGYEYVWTALVTPD